MLVDQWGNLVALGHVALLVQKVRLAQRVSQDCQGGRARRQVMGSGEIRVLQDLKVIVD